MWCLQWPNIPQRQKPSTDWAIISYSSYTISGPKWDACPWSHLLLWLGNVLSAPIFQQLSSVSSRTSSDDLSSSGHQLCCYQKKSHTLIKRPQNGLRVSLERFWYLAPPGGLLSHSCSLWKLAPTCAWSYTPHLRPLKWQIKALCTINKATASLKSLQGCIPCKAYSSAPSFAEEGLGGAEILKVQCHESEDFVDLVIKNTSPGQNQFLRRTSGDQWLSYHLHFSVYSEDIVLVQ